MTPVTAQPTTYGTDASFPRFSVARYQRMIEAGILTPDDKVELLENRLVLKMPRNPEHDGMLLRIGKRLSRRLPAGWDLRGQSALVLVDSQPEPDYAIVRETADDYLSRHPTPADVGLVIEVANSSVLRDQQDKVRIYARAMIPIYWIVNLVSGRVEVYTTPSGPVAVPAYGCFQTYRPGDDVPLVLDGVTVAAVPAADLLP
ncbi:MAG: Uma2 family endonuclease [Gemmataceae bacterium]